MDGGPARLGEVSARLVRVHQSLRVVGGTGSGFKSTTYCRTLAVKTGQVANEVRRTLLRSGVCVSLVSAAWHLARGATSVTRTVSHIRARFVTHRTPFSSCKMGRREDSAALF